MKESRQTVTEEDAFEALENGDGKRAIELFQTRAAMGSDIASYVIGDIYLHGQVGVSQDPVAARESFERAHGSHAKKLKQRSALKLGYIYERGVGVPVDNKKAFTYYEELDESDVPQGLTLLGVMYALGKGTDKDTDKAMELYHRAAKLGHIYGLKNMGLLKIKKGNPLGFFFWASAVLQGIFLGIFRPGSRRIKIL
jgi:TPR repeat protein